MIDVARSTDKILSLLFLLYPFSIMIYRIIDFTPTIKRINLSWVDRNLPGAVFKSSNGIG